MSKSKDCASKSKDFTSESLDFTPKSKDFTSESKDFTPKSKDLTSKSKDFMSKSKDFTSKSLDGDPSLVIKGLTPVFRRGRRSKKALWNKKRYEDMQYAHGAYTMSRLR
jgi:hypothetical protein